MGFQVSHSQQCLQSAIYSNGSKLQLALISIVRGQPVSAPTATPSYVQTHQSFSVDSQWSALSFGRLRTGPALAFSVLRGMPRFILFFFLLVELVPRLQSVHSPPGLATIPDHSLPTSTLLTQQTLDSATPTNQTATVIEYSWFHNS